MSEDGPGLRLGGIVIDTVDLDRLARFWGGLLNLQVTRREMDWVSLGPGLALQRVPEAQRLQEPHPPRDLSSTMHR